jgi:hypothetical protein
MVISTYFFSIKCTEANAVHELLFSVRAHREVQAGGIDHRGGLRMVTMLIVNQSFQALVAQVQL